MVTKTLVVDPVTRIEGHLRFETRMEDGIVVDAWVFRRIIPGHRKSPDRL
jgi:Ni,Fe-hydrogenase I large subunit